MARKRIDVNEYIGNKYGRLTVVEYLGVINGNSKVLCRCECGNERSVRVAELKNGHTKSCGCFQKEVASTRIKRHGEAKTRLYRIWTKIKDRCYNERNDRYESYGGRNITVCDEWRNNYESFRNWALNNGYKDGLSIDRIDVNGNYEPSNCRWATVAEQNRNKRNNHYLTYKGETLPIVGWAERTGIKPSTLYARLDYGWDVGRAITTPVQKRQQRKSN